MPGSRRKKAQLGAGLHKIDAKLRLVANGDTDVNITRAERLGAVGVAANVRLGNRPYSMQFVDANIRAKAPAKGKISRASKDIWANVFIATTSLDPIPGVKETARNAGLVTAKVRLSDIRRIAQRDTVRHMSLGQGLRDPDPVVHPDRPLAPRAEDRRIAKESVHKHGAGTIVGIIDVQGFDFSHPDFLDDRGQTRFEAIWDQGAEPDGTMKPFGFDYGRLITRAQMNAAIKASKSANPAPAFELEPQSQMDEGSHGTHVASIAAGNRGVARKARIVGVLISLAGKDLDRRKTFYDSTRLAHAVQWLCNFPKDVLGKPKTPISINVSLGTNGHAHDSSAPLNRWIDYLLATPGRSVCVAAGNAGQEKPESPDDLGFIVGRIHTDGQIAAAGLAADLEWVVAGSGGRDYSENELEIWFSAQDKIAVSVREPSGVWHEKVQPLQFIENRQLKDGTYLSVYNDLYHPANGSNYIGVYLSPNFKGNPITGIAAGVWVVRLHGIDIRDGRFHGWIERDDPDPLQAPEGEPPRWRFPSFFSETSNRDCSSISTLACGNRVIAVANLDPVHERINITSSQGPTREGRQKPDVAAPGTEIVAAKGFSHPDDPWIAMSGTSMASPYVCGVVSLMLAARPDLTAAQINGILQRSARPLAGKTYTWQNDAGFGFIEPVACIDEAMNVNEPVDHTS